MASASDQKARLVEALEHALLKGVSLERALGEEVFKTEVTRLSNLLIQVKVEWEHNRPPRYYTLKVSEPW